MSDEQNLVHSDVFSSNNEKTIRYGKFYKTSIQFYLLSNENNNNFITDDDGDFDLYRPERIEFTLVHSNETSLVECGYQLWNGALLLCDYIINNKTYFLNKNIIELGAGIGLCSLIVSRYASTIICSDYDKNLLEIVKENIEINIELCRKECIKLQIFDWKLSESNEIDNNIEIILAADVIYDDELTDAFFNVLIAFFQNKSKLHSVYIAIEKRINFYTETLSIECPAYDYYLEKLKQIKETLPTLIIHEILTDTKSLKQSTFIYDRTKELVLWHIFRSD